MLIKDYLFNRSPITAIAVDENNGKYLWIAYQNVNGVCRLEKTAHNDLTQIYFSFDLPVDKIEKLIVRGSSLLVLLNDSENIMYSLSVTNPLYSQLLYTKAEVGVTENIIDITSNNEYIALLTPGILSGTNAKIVVFDTDENYLTTIDGLASGIEMTNVVSLTIDANNDIWIISTENPATLYRVYLQSGGTWLISSSSLE